MGLEALMLVLMLAAAVAALEANDLLSSVILFGAFSFFAAIFYACLGALDVSFTEAALGGVIATVFFVSAIRGTSPSVTARTQKAPAGALSGAALAAAFGVLAWAAASLPAFGDPASPASAHVSPRFIERGLAETGARNLVTGVIVDYRGYDTLGETLVIFTAGLACLLVLPAAWARRPR